jgi:hypothetical protein
MQTSKVPRGVTVTAPRKRERRYNAGKQAKGGLLPGRYMYRCGFLVPSVQRRRRWTASEKVRIVEETFEPRMTVSLVAR